MRQKFFLRYATDADSTAQMGRSEFQTSQIQTSDRDDSALADSRVQNSDRCDSQFVCAGALIDEAMADRSLSGQSLSGQSISGESATDGAAEDRQSRSWFAQLHSPQAGELDIPLLNSRDTAVDGLPEEVAANVSEPQSTAGTQLDQSSFDLSVDNDGRLLWNAERWTLWGLEQFRPGYQLDLLGSSDAADRYYRSVIEELEQLRMRYAAVTDEVIGAIALRHGARLLSFLKYLEAEAAFLTAFRAFEKGMLQDSGVGRVRELARSASWLGRARRIGGDLPGSLRAYEHAIALWRSVLRFECRATERRRVTRSLAAVLAGSSLSLKALGLEERATDLSTQSDTLSAEARCQQLHELGKNWVVTKADW